MSSANALGRTVSQVNVQTYRDSPFVASVTGPVTSAYLLFPTVGGALMWTASVSDGRADWSIERARTNVVPDHTPVELWVNDQCIGKGEVIRRGDY